MKKYFYLLAAALSISAFAETDYSLCSNFIAKTNENVQKTGFAFPFELDQKTGEIKTTDFTMNSTKTNNSQSYSITGGAGSMKITAHQKDTNKMARIEIETSLRNSQGTFIPNKSIVQFDISNGKCYPKVSYKEVNAGGETVKATLFDSKLCRKIQEFFDSNKVASKCFDPNSKDNTAISDIFSKNGYDAKGLMPTYLKLTPVFERTSYSVEQKIIAGEPEAFNVSKSGSKEDKIRMMNMSGGSPLMSAYMILSDCREKGLSEVLQDDAVWKEASSIEASSQAPSKQE